LTNSIAQNIDPDIIIFIEKSIDSGDLLGSETARKLQRTKANGRRVKKVDLLQGCF
jgi:hypothetical protein